MYSSVLHMFMSLDFSLCTHMRETHFENLIYFKNLLYDLRENCFAFFVKIIADWRVYTMQIGGPGKCFYVKMYQIT